MRFTVEWFKGGMLDINTRLTRGADRAPGPDQADCPLPDQAGTEPCSLPAGDSEGRPAITESASSQQTPGG